MQKAKVESRIKVYYELTKPKIWYLLVFTAFAAAITLTNFHDRDIDAIMERTKGRPIPSGRIAPEKARDFGLVLAGISLACAFAISYTTSFWQGILAGSVLAFCLAGSIFVYSYLLKSRSRANRILVGLVGGAPAMI